MCVYSVVCVFVMRGHDWLTDPIVTYDILFCCGSVWILRTIDYQWYYSMWLNDIRYSMTWRDSNSLVTITLVAPVFIDNVIDCERGPRLKLIRWLNDLLVVLFIDWLDDIVLLAIDWRIEDIPVRCRAEASWRILKSSGPAGLLTIFSYYDIDWRDYYSYWLLVLSDY